MTPGPQPTALDIAANRQARKWTRGEIFARALWEISQPLYRFTPRVFWSWRRGLLRLFGARIGAHVHLHATVKVTIPWNLKVDDYAAVGDGVRIYNLGPVAIGRSATVSQGAHLCAGTHDPRRVDLPLIKAAIRIEEAAWICADAFVGPDVKIGAGAIVGARAVVMRDVAAWTIVAGNPARAIGRRELTP